MAVPKDAELSGLLDRFVCVRLVQMYGVDLSRFQFDHAMTWAIFFANADGTIYGRYGTRSALRNQSAREISLAGFKRSVAAAVELHERYVADPAAGKREVAGKQTRHAPPWRRPELIPTLAANERLSVPFGGLAATRNQRNHGVGCIHCHMVPTGELISLHREKKPVPERMIWPYPMPGAVGMHMDPKQCATVRRVFDDSAAAAAGVAAGDEIVRFDGQTILSTADIQWALHNADAPAKLPVVVRRGDAEYELMLELGKDWRRKLGDWRFIHLGVCMQIAGFNGRPTRDGGKRLAILVGRHHQKRLAGIDLRKGDVIVAIDGKREPMNLPEVAEYLLAKAPGSEIEVTRRRGRSEKTVRLPVK